MFLYPPSIGAPWLLSNGDQKGVQKYILLIDYQRPCKIKEKSSRIRFTSERDFYQSKDTSTQNKQYDMLYGKL